METPTHASRPVLIYGCYGYTGRLIVDECMRLGLPIRLSGRDTAKVTAMAQSLGLPAHPADLRDTPALDAALSGCALVIHSAGPFSQTYQPMAEACLRLGVHYLDITGEIAVFEGLHALDAAAKAARIMLLPGAGFDVVPSDCLAARLHQRLPSATQLHLAILAQGGSSHGTALTMVEAAGHPSLARRDGVIVPRPMGGDRILADFGRGPKPAVGIPWGDVSTAYHSTGIPNITTYVATPPSAARALRLSNFFGWFLRLPFMKAWMRRRVLRQPQGPSPEARARSRSMVWGTAISPDGQRIEDRVTTPNGYTFTAQSAAHIAQRVLQGDHKPGFQTPSSAYGPQLLEQILASTPA